MFGVVGSFVAVLGIHLTIGGLIGTVLGMMDPLAAVCDGPHCAVGVDAGVVGITIGVFVSLFGFALRGKD